MLVGRRAASTILMIESQSMRLLLIDTILHEILVRLRLQNRACSMLLSTTHSCQSPHSIEIIIKQLAIGKQNDLQKFTRIF